MVLIVAVLYVYLWELIFIDVNIDWAEGVAECRVKTYDSTVDTGKTQRGWGDW